MQRGLALSVGIGVLIAAPFGAAAPFRTGGGPESTKTPDRPIDAKKIIAEIQADYRRALQDLEKDNPSAEAQGATKRITEGIKKLLEQQDPGSKGQNTAKPPKPKSPSGQPPPAPAPKTPSRPT